jgi:hypothetical protein
MEVFDNRLDFAIREQRIVGRQLQSPIQQRMMIKNARFWASMVVRPAIPAGVRQLQADEKAVIRASGLNMLLLQNGS